MTVLTYGQRKVAEKLAQGLSDKQIGEALGIHYRTAANHLSHIRERLGTTGRVETVLELIRRRLIVVEGLRAES